MTIFIGPMKKHINGFKNLTDHNEVLTINPDIVSIPLMHARANIIPLVNEGDYVKIGDLIGKRDDNFYVPFYSSVSGKVLKIEKKMSTTLKPVDHIVIENDHKDEFGELKKLDNDASKEEIVDYMKEIGLIGKGGAGFPAYIKYSTDKCESLVINAVECEPFITSDARTIEENLHLFKQGVKFALKASNAKVAYVCIKNYKKELISKMSETFSDIENVVVFPVRDFYPMGYEKTLIYEVLKRNYDKLPIEAGAIVSNVTTLIDLAKSAETGLPSYEKIVTVSGDGIKKPHNIKCRIGTSFKELIDACDGLNGDSINLIAGGPMMGTCVTKDEVCVGLTTNAITILKNIDYETKSCLRCGTCVEHCPVGLEPVNIVKAAKAKSNERLTKLNILECKECGICTYVCPSKIEVTELIKRAKKTYKK